MVPRCVTIGRASQARGGAAPPQASLLAGLRWGRAPAGCAAARRSAGTRPAQPARGRLARFGLGRRPAEPRISAPSAGGQGRRSPETRRPTRPSVRRGGSGLGGERGWVGTVPVAAGLRARPDAPEGQVRPPSQPHLRGAPWLSTDQNCHSSPQKPPHASAEWAPFGSKVACHRSGERPQTLFHAIGAPVPFPS